MAAMRYARSGDAYIAYEVDGSGPIDVLFVTEGFIPVDMMFEEPHFARVLRRLSSFARLIRFDRRGIGLSDPCVPTNPPTLEQWCDDALAVLDAVGSERAAVMGANEAGGVALLLGASHPDRISHVVVVNSFACITEDLADPTGPQISDETLEKMLDDIVTPNDGGAVDIVSEFAPSLGGDAQFRAWWHEAGKRGASPSTARALLRVGLGSDLRNVLPAVRTPTLVAHYRSDVTTPVAHGRYVAQRVPDARYVEVDAADDVWWAADPDPVLNEVEEFLTGIRGALDPDRVLATVLFTDLVASTDQLADVGDRRWRDVLDGHDKMARRQIDRFAGRVIKTTGDGVLAIFDGPARAIRAACAIRDVAQQMGLESRAGVHAGEIEVRDHDVAGIAVHVAARVCDFGEANEVIVTRTIRDLTAGSTVRFADRGEHALKGLDECWQLYAVSD
jgi:class 3 adenylate cyclase